MSTTNDDAGGFLAKQQIIQYVEDALRREVARSYEVLRKKLLEDLDRDKDILISGIVLNVMKSTDVQMFGERITITVKTKQLTVPQ